MEKVIFRKEARANGLETGKSATHKIKEKEKERNLFLLLRENANVLYIESIKARRLKMIVKEQRMTENTSLIMKQVEGGYRVIVLWIAGEFKGREYGSFKIYKTLAIANREFTKAFNYTTTL